jgi:hypothetical protein
VTQLSRLAILGCAPESVAGTYVSPTFYVPFTKADFEDVYTELKDESYRANDTLIQGMYQGPVHATWNISVLSYPDIVGHFLRGIIGPDTVTAGVSTTVATGGSLAGATTLSVNASIAANTYISVGAGSTLEYAFVTAVSGSGPYNLTVTTVVGQTVGLTKAHIATEAVQATSTHVFKQSSDPTTKKTYSFTVYDTTQTVSYSGAAMSDLAIKIDPKSAVMFDVKYMTFPQVVQSKPTPTYTALPPALGWEWNMTNAGATTSRGLTYDMTVKRAVEPIHSSDGIQAPREIFQGALEVDGTYKTIFENQTDLNLYLNYTQTPTTATLQQPASGTNGVGASLALTMSKSGYFKGKRDLSSSYVQADFSLAGIYNATDGGAVSATLVNYQSTAY